MENAETMYNKVCRLCLSFDNDEMVPLLDENSKLTSYGVDAQTFAQITIENIKAPPSMCKQCLTLLNETKQFIIKCKESQTYFEKLENCSDFDRTNTLARLLTDVVREPTAKTEVEDTKPNIFFHVPLLPSDGSTDSNPFITPLHIKTESDFNETISQPKKVKALFKADKTKTKCSKEVINALRHNLNITVKPISKEKIGKKLTNSSGPIHPIIKEEKQVDNYAKKYPYLSSILGNCSLETNKLSSVKIKKQRESESDQDEWDSNRSATPTSIESKDISCMDTKFDDKSSQNVSELDSSISNINTIPTANTLANISYMASNETIPVGVKPNDVNPYINLWARRSITSASPAAKTRSTNIDKPITVLGFIKPLADTSPKLSRPYKCNICMKSYTLKRNLVFHMRQHTGPKKPVEDSRFKIVTNGFKCSYCPKTYNTKSAILNHVKKHVITIKPLVEVEEKYKKVDDHFECNSCKKVFNTKHSISNHVKRHKPRGFVCEHCAKSFFSNAELRCHLLYTHKEGNLRKCSECDFTAVTHNEMAIHKRLHTGERPFICDHCGLGFRDRQVLKRHLLTHYEKSVQCPKCPVKVYTRAQLTVHDNQAHNRRQLHGCPLCDKLYKRQGVVRKHLVKIHGVPREKQGKIPIVKLNSTEPSSPIALD